MMSDGIDQKKKSMNGIKQCVSQLMEIAKNLNAYLDMDEDAEMDMAMDEGDDNQKVKSDLKGMKKNMMLMRLKKAGKIKNDDEEYA